jgi:hypothetical protein
LLILRTFLSCAALVTSAVQAEVFVLYLGVDTETPADQNWVYTGTGEASQSAVDGVTTFTTMAGNDAQVGYSRWPLSPSIDRHTGYTITIDMRLELEEHASNNRAGFSIIVLSNGDSNGIELGFWTDRIWAQDATFTQAEMVMFDTSTAFNNYALTVLEDRYYLLANGQQMLSGPLRNYAAAVAYPYSLENFLFMGDDTSSARAQVSITGVELRYGSDLVMEEVVLQPQSSWRYMLQRED